MKVLPEGTLKFLLLDPEVIKRNSERDKPGAPVCLVAVPDDKLGFVFIEGFAVLATGPVTLAYSQRKPLALRKRIPVFAAYSTTGEVRIATERDEDLTVSAPAAPTSTKKATK